MTFSMARARSTSLSATPIWRMIASGSSPRGLSESREHPVGEPPGHLAHQRALARVAVAPAPKTTISLPPALGGKRPQGAENLLQRVRRMRIVDDNQRRVGDALHAPGDRRQSAISAIAAFDPRPNASRQPSTPSALATLKRPTWRVCSAVEQARRQILVDRGRPRWWRSRSR
jgi:hypothetical protein